MSAIFGIINNKGEAIDKKLIDKVREELSYWNPDYCDYQIKGESGFVSLILHTTPESVKEKQPLNKNSITICFDGRIDNREEIIDSNKFLRYKNSPDSSLVYALYEKYGADCVSQIEGDFAFSIYNHKEKTLYCYRDRFGVKPFYYYSDNEKFIFCSEPRGIITALGYTPELDEEVISKMLVITPPQKHKTSFKGLYRLVPASFLRLKNGELTQKEYWDLNKQRELIFSKKEDYYEGLREKFEIAVKRRLRSKFNIGAELSGGLDSSSVAAMAALDYPELYTFSHALEDYEKSKFPYNDEREFITEVLKFSGIENTSFVTCEGAGLLTAIKRGLFLNVGPASQNFSIFSDPLYKAAQEKDIRILLSGFGGDELVTNKATGAIQEFANKGDWKTVSQHLNKRYRGKPAKLVKNYVTTYMKKAMPEVHKKLSNFKETFKENDVYSLAINNALIEKYRLEEDFMKISFESYNVLRELQYETVTKPHISQRLEQSAIAANSRKIEYRYPFLDKELIEYYLAMPADLKVSPGIGRFAFREAMKGVIPEKIRMRQDKSGFTIPTIYKRFYTDLNGIKALVKNGVSPEASRYIKQGALYEWVNRLETTLQTTKKGVYPSAFFNHLKLILYLHK